MKCIRKLGALLISVSMLSTLTVPVNAATKDNIQVVNIENEQIVVQTTITSIGAIATLIGGWWYAYKPY